MFPILCKCFEGSCDVCPHLVVVNSFFKFFNLFLKHKLTPLKVITVLWFNTWWTSVRFISFIFHVLQCLLKLDICRHNFVCFILSKLRNLWLYHCKVLLSGLFVADQVTQEWNKIAWKAIFPRCWHKLRQTNKLIKWRLRCLHVLCKIVFENWLNTSI